MNEQADETPGIPAEQKNPEIPAKGQPRTPTLKKRQERIKALILETLPRTYTIAACARVLKISRDHIYDLMARDSKFAEAVQSVKFSCVELLEASAYQDALRGKEVTRIFMLKAARPEVYGDRQKIEHSGSVALSEWLLSAGSDKPGRVPGKDKARP